MAMCVKAFISIGANIDPEINIKAALSAMMRSVKVANVSTFYRTKPIGKSNSPDFVNGVIEIETDIDPKTLKFRVLREIEADLGRERSEDRNAPRTIDLDLIVYSDEVIDVTGLRIPDPNIRKRPFIAAPLFELAPCLILSDTGETLDSLEAAMSSSDMEALSPFTDELKRIIRDESKKS